MLNITASTKGPDKSSCDGMDDRRLRRFIDLSVGVLIVLLSLR